MNIFEIILIGIGLAMDAFAVSICKGLSMKKRSPGKIAVIGLWFGGFQALMPLLGYLLGAAFSGFVQAIDHWIAFVLLALIGINMIRESFKDDEEGADDRVDAKAMLPLAIATSIDALAVGVTMAFLNVNLVLAVTLIGVITFVICVIGVLIGHKAGEFLKKRAKLLGGIVLILIGAEILIKGLIELR